MFYIFDLQKSYHLLIVQHDAFVKCEKCSSMYLNSIWIYWAGPVYVLKIK